MDSLLVSMLIGNRKVWRRTYLDAAERESDPANAQYWLDQAAKMAEEIQHLRDGCEACITGDAGVLHVSSTLWPGSRDYLGGAP